MNYWTTKEGVVLRITELSDSHLINIVKKFKESIIEGYTDIDGTPLYVGERDKPEGYAECKLEAKVRRLIK